jgi:RHS repeat-associated protein
MHPSSNALKLITVFIMLFACHVLYGMGSGNEQSVTHEDLYQGSLRALVKRGTNHTVALAAYKDYYPYGQLMPGRNYQTTDYRYGYQGQYAETDPETGFAHFEAREFDSRLGRYMVPDPAGQYWSPYMGMGNNPVSGVDPDGQYDTKFGAWLNKFLFGGNKLVYTESRKEWGVEYNPDNGTGEFEVAIRYSGQGGTPWYSIYNWPALGSSAQTMDALYDGNYLEASVQFANCATEVFTFGIGSSINLGTKVTVGAAKTGTTVLGHYPEYVKLAESIGARRFQIPTSVWNKMSAAEQWTANTKFLDRMILRGDKIRLATPLNQVKPGSFFQKELNYLFDKGYKVSSDGLWLTK